MPKSKVRTQVRTRPETDKAIKVVNIMRRRFRMPGIRGRNTKMKQDYQYTPPEGNSVSYFTKKAMPLRGFRKRRFKSEPLQMRNIEIVSNLAWNYGTQASVTILHNTQGEINNISSIPSSNVTSSIFLQSSKIHYMITSASKAAIKLRIYEGCMNRDMEAAFTPSTLWTNGMLDSGTTMTPGSIDAKPWQSPSFNQCYHISKVTNVFLPQGRTHEHYSTYGYNKMFNREVYNTSTDKDYLKGWTRFIMFVGYSEPVGDSADTDITTGSGRLMIVGTKCQRWRYATPTTYTATYVKSIPTTGITQERLLDEGAGEVEQNVSV